MTEPREPIEFRGGVWASAVPLFVFLFFTGGLVISGGAKEEGMIVGAMIGISVGMLFVRNVTVYSERVFTLMANRVAAVAVVCWLWAGAFGGILGGSGLVEATVWIGWKLGLSGGAFALAVFMLAALFAVSVGTGLGTVVGFTPIMYPAGIVLGADPAVLMGAIFSGAAFGDNLAPISDTTIVSATTQETDVAGVVASRIKYVMIAAVLSGFLFFVLGDGKSVVDPNEADRLLRETASPKGLPMLIPALIVFMFAIRGFHFLAALTAGIVSALILGPLIGVFSLSDVFRIAADGQIVGNGVKGAMGLVPISILTLLLVTSIGLMAEGGFLSALMSWLDRTISRSARGAEASIVALISFANLCVSVNTVAMITAGPLVNEMRKRHGIHPYRSANLLDTVSCSFPYLLPYAATFPTAAAIQRQVHEIYPFVPVLSWSQEVGFMFYGIILFPVMVISVITGFGRRKG